MKDIYSTVTNQIIQSLEKGNLKWLCPWGVNHQAGNISRPLRHDGTPYSGINVIMLWLSSMESGFYNPLWLTYKQASEMGANVKKGAKGSLVVYANKLQKTVTNKEGEEEVETIPFMKGYTVFNAEQIEGLPQHYYATAASSNKDSRLEDIEKFFSNTKANVQHGGNIACYVPSQDLVRMPEFGFFQNKEGYYSTLAHEMAHWTRHESRLNRDFGRKRFGDEGYAMEELVAEISAAFLCAELNITPEIREDHAAYVESWLRVLKNDKRAIFTAASHAQKAVEHLKSYQASQ